MPKALDLMTASEIEKAYNKAHQASSDNCREFINAGRGNERGSDIRTKTDPLALEYIRANDVLDAINDEIAARKRYHGGKHRIIRKGG